MLSPDPDPAGGPRPAPAGRPTALEELRRRERQQTLVAQLGRSALTGTGFDDLVAEALKAVVEGLEADRACFFETVPGEGVLACRLERGRHAAGMHAVAIDADSIVAETFRARDPCLVPDLATGRRFADSAELLALGLGSAAAAPVRGDPEPTGVVSAYSTGPGALGDDAIIFLRAVANVLAVVVSRERAEALRRESEASLAFLAEAGHVLAGSLDYDSTLQTLASLVVPRLADWFIVDLVQPDGAVRRAAVAAALPEKRRLLDELLREFAASADGPSPASLALARGETVHFPDFTPESLRATTVGERHFELLRALDPRSAIGVPLLGRSGVLGALTFARSESGRRYEETDVKLAEDLARRAVSAIENARLFQSEQAARSAAEEAQGRLAVLAEAGKPLVSSLDHREALAGLAHRLVPQLADLAAVYLAGEDGSLELLVAERARGAAGLDAAVSRDLAAGAVASGVPAVRRAVPAGPRRELDAICVPLAAHGRVYGAILLVARSSRRRYGEDDVRLAEELAGRAALMVDNSRLYREAEERAEAARALATVADGVCLVTRDHVVKVWNPAAAAITGLQADDVLGRRMPDVLEGWGALAELVSLAPPDDPHAATPRTFPIAVGGRELWLSVVGVGSADAVVYTFRDVTDEARLDRLKSDFVATVSHELRTPLTSVYGAAVTLAERDLGDRPELREHLVDLIVGQSERLAAIIDDVLLAGELEGGRLRLLPSPIDPVASARAAVESARARSGNGAVVELVANGAVAPIEVDAGRLRQVLDNLLENAIKYSPEGSRVDVHVEAGDDWVRFRVRDEGVGIPPDEFERIFEKFYRLDPEQTRGVGGTGLGLYVCRELVARMGGRIRVESAPGRGSTFTVELPRRPGQGPARPPSTAG